ncbi:hypothetical protein JXO59_16740 [candidate division KSB1 bacterium]|nr:hypothetical protein [candidate division KSB1 bacterium]
MIAYKYTQTGYWIIVPLIIAAVILFATVPLDDYTMVHYALLLLFIIVGVLFYSLTTEVKAGRILCYFGQGLINKEIRVTEIASCEPVKVPWYWGWGIRWTPIGWMYNISPTGGVKITFTSGKSFVIGSNEPEVLCDAILDEMKKVKGA